jgi:GT2 family glycosyltransferase
MKADAVIPNYNGLTLLKENLPKVIEEIRRYKGSVVIVDDGSDQKEFKELDAFIKKLADKSVILLRNEKNLGFSSAVNIGVNQSNADFVVLLNTDVIPEENFLEVPIKDLESDENLFGVGFMDKSMEDRETVLRGRGLAVFRRGFLFHKRGEVDRQDTFWVSGGSSIIRREIFKKLSGFDTLYNPFYWEDIDLSYRARKSGYSIKFQPKSTVIHRHSEGAVKRHFSNFQIKTIAYRNQFIFVWKNITDFNLFNSHLVWLPFHLISAVLRFDLAFILGFLLALVRLPAIIIRRFRQKKLYKLSDSDLFKD